ncbi:calcium:proton antiporter [Catelliglobosispora koreensis]|uniref:calcium:proton antiporter n=1 Tax=Catelliglobosispora koreensis TaxID=129052 RepID=UPI00035F07C7|nr:hypothetical protein [Catelliglobosispora koreensis]
MDFVAGKDGRFSPPWTVIVPVAALLPLFLLWGRKPPIAGVIVVALLLGAAVLAAVHHAEVIAHRVGEPMGSLTLAVAVTVIEVGLIVTLMSAGGPKSYSLARDTVFAAVMITCNGIVGLALVSGTLRRKVALFNAEGTGAAWATVATIATLSLVLPTFTTSQPGPEFAPAQLAFAGVASLALYGLFVLTQTKRHRDFFQPIATDGTVIDTAAEDAHGLPSIRASMLSLGFLVVAMVAVVGDAKLISPSIEDSVAAAGLPAGVVGVVIALLVLLPEGMAAVRAARRDRIQVSLNLAVGSAIASIGLTIPAVALASVWLDGPLILGLGPIHMALLALTIVVGTLTIVPGRATLLNGSIHLAILAAFLVLTTVP